MCNRCTWAWLPMNHRNSHGLTRFGDRFHWERIHNIQNPLAEMRRQARMGCKPSWENGKRYDSLSFWREIIQNRRPLKKTKRGTKTL